MAAAVAAAYEDNFGFWDVDEPEELAFFEHVQRQSVRKICKRCRRPVRLMAPKILCAPCVSALECGAPISMSEYALLRPCLGLPLRRPARERKARPARS